MQPDGRPTSAALQVAPEVREARRDELISLQQRVGEEWAKSHVGKEVSVVQPPPLCRPAQPHPLWLVPEGTSWILEPVEL